MEQRNKYNTKQKELVRRYLSENNDEHFTAKMIASALSDEVGQTTVYRNLDLLVKEKAIIKYEMPDGKSAYYQYAEPINKGCHILCTECGKMVDLKCHLVSELSEHIKEEHRFNFDQTRTVLHGLCEQCV